MRFETVADSFANSDRWRYGCLLFDVYLVSGFSYDRAKIWVLLRVQRQADSVNYFAIHVCRPARIYSWHSGKHFVFYCQIQYSLISRFSVFGCESGLFSSGDPLMFFEPWPTYRKTAFGLSLIHI